ncbi:MAG: class V aminotransferase [Acidobacteria bacterium SCN 69-37]|nr:MAG: class V aminotransferase [Acidobacteria bacterium SCN 69-37]
MTSGRSLLPLWPLDPTAIYLNHGTVGVTPRRVLAAQQAWRDRMERHPARFMLRDLWTFAGTSDGRPTLMRQAAAEVAAFVGAWPDDLVFVDNTTTGVNAVLRSLPLGAGDDVLVTDHLYGGIMTGVTHISRAAGATVRTVEAPYPAFDAAEAVDRIARALTDRTRLVIVDHIAAETAIVWPVAEIVRACHAKGVAVLVDGAHVPGAIALDVVAIDADFYVANLHKWAMAPRSAAFLVVREEHQAAMHPAVISWGLDRGFTQEFDWMGTRDPTPWLTAPDGLRFLHDLGYEDLRRANHDLAWRAARYLSDRWSTPLSIDEAAVGCMVSVMVPSSVGMTTADAMRLRDRLLFEHDIEVQVHARAGRVWVRVSAQIYNEFADIDALGRAVVP